MHYIIQYSKHYI